MNDEVELHESAVGDCIVCGEDATGSLYWQGMSESQWVIIRPYVTEFFKLDQTQKVLFIAPYDKPLCSPECSVKYKEKKDEENSC